MQPPNGAPHGRSWPAMRPCLPGCTWPSSTSMVYTTTGRSAPQVNLAVFCLLVVLVYRQSLCSVVKSHVVNVSQL